jgi:hypothetical protein
MKATSTAWPVRSIDFVKLCPLASMCESLITFCETM